MSMLMFKTRVQHISALKANLGFFFFFVTSPSLLLFLSLRDRLKPERLKLFSFVCIEKKKILFQFEFQF